MLLEAEDSQEADVASLGVLLGVQAVRSPHLFCPMGVDLGRLVLSPFLHCSLEGLPCLTWKAFPGDGGEYWE